jgi:hypothetical protein
MKTPLKMFTTIAGIGLLGALPASAAIAVQFEFNTAGDNEGWTHNGAINGGATGAKQVTAGSGEGVLTAAALPGNGDLRVLYNPDIALPGGFTGWTTIDVRFRQLNGLDGAPEALTGTLTSLHFGTTGSGSSSIDGNGFVEETPLDTEFWYTASVDISGMGANDITQIRLDPIADTTKDYQIDWVRVSANPVPEPSSALLGILGTGFFFLRRRRN